MITILECQTGVIAHNNQRTNVYGTQQNDIWSLGVILINLVTGRNPWKQAHMEDHTFAAYIQQPETFFTTILPTISKEMNDILLRVFCLDPSHRISLPELKYRIKECKSFLCNQPDMKMNNNNVNKNMKKASIKQQQLHIYTNQFIQASNSMTQTILDYTDVFSTTTPTTCPCSTSSSNSSASSSMNTPITPTLSFLNDFYSKKITSDALIDIMQTSALFTDF